MTNQNGALKSREHLEIKEAFLRLLTNIDHDERLSDDLVAAINGLLQLEPSRGAWMLETLRAEKVKGTLSSSVFDELEQRIMTALHTREDNGALMQTTIDNHDDEDTQIEALMVSDEDTAVDHELLYNGASTATDVFTDKDSEQSAAVSIATDMTHQGPIKAEGDTLNDRYEIIECIGTGGMSKVYQAVDRHKVEAGDPIPLVAVKILNRKYNFLENWPYILQREAEKCQSLVHPNIVDVFDFGYDGATVYMVMEYLSGESLRTTINAPGFQGMPVHEAQHIITAAAHALTFAHDRGVVHRDFKPGNVIVTDEGKIKVIDFGIAQAFQNVNEPDADAQFRGAITPIYASPEMLEHKDSDPRDDVFSLACTAYQLITGQHPFNRIPATEARDIGTRLKRSRKLSGPQWRAIRHALNFNRDKRTASVSAFVEAFTAYAMPWKPAAALAAGIFAVAVTGFLITNQLLIKGNEEIDGAQVALYSPVQTEATQDQQSVYQQPVSEVAGPSAEQESDVLNPLASHSAAQPQDLVSSSSNEPADEQSQLLGEPLTAEPEEITLHSNKPKDQDSIDANPQPEALLQDASQPPPVIETQSASTTVLLDQAPILESADVHTPGLEQNSDNDEAPATAPLSETLAATSEPNEETRLAAHITEFSSVASVAHPSLTLDGISDLEDSTDPEPHDSLKEAPGNRLVSPQETTSTMQIHSAQTLFQSAKRGDLQTIDSIIESGFPLDTRERSSGATAIIMASRRGHTDVVNALLNAGADPQTMDDNDMNALLWATDGGHCAVVNVLSAHGIDTEVRNSVGETALLAAAWDGHEDIVRGLLSNGADVDARNNEGWSALINASINGHLSVVHTLLESGADPSVRSNDGKTALMAAAWNGHADIVRLLSTNKSEVSKANAEGWTPLMNAAWNGHGDVVKILVDSGTDVRVVNADNHTAESLAISQGHKDIAMFLKRAR